MMVLFLKQVHLQKVGAAGNALAIVRTGDGDFRLHAAASEMRAPSRRRNSDIRAIAANLGVEMRLLISRDYGGRALIT